MDDQSEKERYEELQEEMGARGLIGRSLEQANRRKLAEREGRDIEFLVPVRNNKIYGVGVLLLISGLLILLFIVFAFTQGLFSIRVGIIGAVGVILIQGGRRAMAAGNLSLVEVGRQGILFNKKRLVLYESIREIKHSVIEKKMMPDGKEVASQKWNLSIITSDGQETHLGSRWLDGGWDDDEGRELVDTIERVRKPVPSPFATKG